MTFDSCSQQSYHNYTLGKNEAKLRYVRTTQNCVCFAAGPYTNKYILSLNTKSDL